MELSKENQEWLDRNKYDDGLGGYDMSPDDVKAKLMQDQQKIEDLEYKLNTALKELKLARVGLGYAECGSTVFASSYKSRVVKAIELLKDNKQ